MQKILNQLNTYRLNLEKDLKILKLCELSLDSQKNTKNQHSSRTNSNKKGSYQQQFTIQSEINENDIQNYEDDLITLPEQTKQKFKSLLINMQQKIEEESYKITKTYHLFQKQKKMTASDKEHFSLLKLRYNKLVLQAEKIYRCTTKFQQISAQFPRIEEEVKQEEYLSSQQNQHQQQSSNRFSNFNSNPSYIINNQNQNQNNFQNQNVLFQTEASEYPERQPNQGRSKSNQNLQNRPPFSPAGIHLVQKNLQKHQQYKTQKSNNQESLQNQPQQYYTLNPNQKSTIKGNSSSSRNPNANSNLNTIQNENQNFAVVKSFTNLKQDNGGHRGFLENQMQKIRQILVDTKNNLKNHSHPIYEKQMAELQQSNEQLIQNVYILKQEQQENQFSISELKRMADQMSQQNQEMLDQLQIIQQNQKNLILLQEQQPATYDQYNNNEQSYNDNENENNYNNEQQEYEEDEDNNNNFESQNSENQIQNQQNINQTQKITQYNQNYISERDQQYEESNDQGENSSSQQQKLNLNQNQNYSDKQNSEEQEQYEANQNQLQQLQQNFNNLNDKNFNNINSNNKNKQRFLIPTQNSNEPDQLDDKELLASWALRKLNE